MSQSKPAPDDPGDPSMEDILASIRRILNDGEPASGQPAGASPHAEAIDEPETVHEPALSDGDEDVFLLDQTMLIKEPPRMDAEEQMAAPDHEPPVPQAASPAVAEEEVPHPSAPAAAPPEPLLAPSTAAAASASLGALVRVVGQRQTAVYRGGPTIEDIVREEIRPLMKAWLDENLAPMVERMVRHEIERVTRND